MVFSVAPAHMTLFPKIVFKATDIWRFPSDKKKERKHKRHRKSQFERDWKRGKTREINVVKYQHNKNRVLFICAFVCVIDGGVETKRRERRK
jgi:hypothetical protein